MKLRRGRKRLVTARTAMQFLEAQLEAPTEAEWHATRLERLGRVIFGDLWDSNEPKAAREQPEPP